MGRAARSTKHPRRAGLILIVCLAAASVLAPPTGHTAPGKRPRLAALVSTDLTSDPTVPTCAPESLFRALLDRKDFVEGEPAKGLTGGYRRYANPFQSGSEVDSVLDVMVELELEQASYAAPGMAEKDLISFWWFGVFSWAFKPQDSVVGLVQWRARLRWAGQDAPLEVVGMGYASGRSRDLSRVVALRLANKRALWDLGAKVAHALNKTMDLEYHNRQIDMSAREYRDLVDGW